jgi:hypothetical protein
MIPGCQDGYWYRLCPRGFLSFPGNLPYRYRIRLARRSEKREP